GECRLATVLACCACADKELASSGRMLNQHCGDCGSSSSPLIYSSVCRSFVFSASFRVSLFLCCWCCCGGRYVISRIRWLPPRSRRPRRERRALQRTARAVCVGAA
ncbi:hypothetical protein DQ04_27781000, partial [Trypanosoma grayi]|uniref:hypothetical protein n=1 Tax=Trypanosoma grayi TaxID=71804 RepID=UPI0004F4842C